MLSKVVSRRFLEVMLLMEDGEERYLWSGMFLPDFDPFWISELGKWPRSESCLVWEEI